MLSGLRIGFQEFGETASDDAKEAKERFKGRPSAADSTVMLHLAAGISASMLTLTRFMHGDDSQGIMVLCLFGHGSN